MLRYYWHRSKFFLQAYQQVGYKNNEYWQWMKEHWSSKVIPWELGLFSLLIFVTILPNNWFPIWPTAATVAVIFFSYAAFWLGNVKRYKPDKVKKPLVLTNRVKRLLIPFVLFTAYLPVEYSLRSFSGINRLPGFKNALLSYDIVLLSFGWVIGAIAIPFIVVLSGSLTKPVEKLIQEGFKKKARNKLASMPHLKVIAITGSYGKTSTKFMVHHLLKERFNVCTTPGSYNTPMGICKVINNDLQSHHQILILEMGARYQGNIQELCDIAQPDVSIVTNIGFAHLETFGSQEVIAREKGRIVDNLPPGGVAILNADDHHVSKMGEHRTDIKRIMVGLNKGSVQASAITYDTSGSRFNVTIDGQKEEFHTQLLGAHNVTNMLLAIGTAHHFGIRPKTMALAARNIEPVEHRLQLKQTNNLTIIDDAFNSNPVGAKNAVEILAQFKSGKRIIITPGMVELGDRETEENRKLGIAIGKAALDKIILVGEERTKPIKEGIETVPGQAAKITVVNSLFEANELVRKIAEPGDVILYENDLPDVYNEG